MTGDVRHVAILTRSAPRRNPFRRSFHHGLQGECFQATADIVPFANSDAVEIGQPVVAVGNPLGIGTSVSTGVISGLNRNLMRSPFDDYLQTDAAINPGNSGGPLLDCAGKIVGIDTALISNSARLGSIGLGFAIPANVVRYVAARLENPDKALPNWVGLHLQDLTAPLAIAFGLPISTGGAIVTDADPDGPAGRGGIGRHQQQPHRRHRCQQQSRAAGQQRDSCALPQREPVTALVMPTPAAIKLHAMRQRMPGSSRTARLGCHGSGQGNWSKMLSGSTGRR